MKFDIKTEPNFPHHYIIAVAIHPATSSKAGTMYMKYRPVYFTNEDVEHIQHAAMLTVDKLFKTTDSEAFKCVGKVQLASQLSSLKLAASVNQCTLHHFSTEYETDEESFDNIVNLANTSDYYKELLKNSKLRG